MTLDAAIWASSTALPTKVALACWLASSMLMILDCRRLVVKWRMLLQIVGVIACGLASRSSVSLDAIWLWRVNSLLAMIATVLSFREWLDIKPRETFEEAAREDVPPRSRLHPSRSPSARRDSILQLVQTPGGALNLLGLALSAFALGLVIYRALPGPPTILWLGVIHALTASLLLGATLSVAIELTFGSAPGAISQVKWQAIANVALACSLCELLVVAVILTRPIGDAQYFGGLLISRMFAISVVLIDLIAWIIPQRVANFNRTGKAYDWVSLTLAAWICVVSLLVLVALPSTWPWSTMALSPTR